MSEEITITKFRMSFLFRIISILYYYCNYNEIQELYKNLSFERR